MARAAALILDLDGTLYRGDAPLLAYADAMAAMAGPPLGDALSIRARAFLADPAAFAPYRDPWATISAFGGDAGLDWPRRDLAFVGVRQAICRGEIAIEVPSGLGAFLSGLDRRVRVAVLTNSDEASALHLLRFLGLGDLSRATRGMVHKPKGFAGAVRPFVTGLRAAQAVSVGDNQTNDIEPAKALGFATVHVRAPGALGGVADHTVAHLEEAFAWLDGHLANVLAARPLAAGDEEEAWA